MTEIGGILELVNPKPAFFKLPKANAMRQEEAKRLVMAFSCGMYTNKDKPALDRLNSLITAIAEERNELGKYYN